MSSMFYVKLSRITFINQPLVNVKHLSVKTRFLGSSNTVSTTSFWPWAIARAGPSSLQSGSLTTYRNLSVSWNALRQAAKKSVSEPDSVMRVLNVAEKNDAAKHLAKFMSNGNSRLRQGLSVFNKLYEWDYTLFNQRCQMTMTSVSGHLLALEFDGNYRNWHAHDPVVLFDAPVRKTCIKDFEMIKRTLEREVRLCQVLIIWTDCDREGEAIGFEIIDVCKAVKQNIQVYRAKFSEITQRSVDRAIRTLGPPDQNVNAAVNVRTELDLRIGAAFTRFQTLHLQRVFPAELKGTISYGSCQFPTLGFVVERYKAKQNFVAEDFWRVKVVHTIGELSVEFVWKRGRLFDELACETYYDMCVEEPKATVEHVQSKPKNKWRPLPLDTVEMEKLGSRKLKINAKSVMKIAEGLYTKGFISYPRTETNIFPKELDLLPLVQMQTEDERWGEFAAGVAADGPTPRAGRKTDQAHPPIHPTRYTHTLQGDDKRVYELIVRHFLACCSKDAEGLETVVGIDINGEKFSASGLMIIARNYLDVYPYDRWSAKEIHVYQPNQVFLPTSIEMVDGETSAPNLLTEADLIALMEKHGIGTDATHAEHIETIKTRKYAGLDGIYFVPGQLGMGLVDGYDNMGFAMSKPNLRAELEADLKMICDGTKDPAVVLSEQIARYKSVFQVAVRQAHEMDQALRPYLQHPNGNAGGGGDPPPPPPPPGGGGPRGGGGGGGPPRGGGGGDHMPPPSPPPPPTQRRANQSHDSGVGSSFGSVGSSRPAQSSAGSSNRSAQSSSKAALSSSSSSTSRSAQGSSSSSTSRAALSSANSSTSRAAQGSSSSSTSRAALSSSSSSTSRAALSLLSNESPVVCNCNVDAAQHTVRKEGPNQGRLFYACARTHGECKYFLWASEEGSTVGSSSGFMSSAVHSNYNNNNNSNSNSNSSDEVKCKCGEAAKCCITQKEGPNQGRAFYVCAKLMDDSTKCDMFAGGEGGGGGGGGGAETKCNCGEAARRNVTQKPGANQGRAFFACPKFMSDPGKCNFFLWDDGNTSASDGNNAWPKPDNSWTRADQGSAPNITQPKKRRKCSNCHEEGHTIKKCPRLA